MHKNICCEIKNRHRKVFSSTSIVLWEEKNNNTQIRANNINYYFYFSRYNEKIT